MVLLLNYLPWIIAALGVFLVYKAHKKASGPKRNRAIAFIAVGTIASLILLQGLTAGYIPKMRSSEVKIAAPAFEVSEAEMQNRLRSPERLGKESEERFNTKTDWRQHKRDEQAKATPAPVEPPAQ